MVGTWYARTRCSSSRRLHRLWKPGKKGARDCLVCKSGLLASRIGGCFGKVSFYRWLYRLRLLSAASTQAPCLWLVARRTGDSCEVGPLRESRPSRGPYHEQGSLGPTRRLDLVASDRGRVDPGVRADELPEVATLEKG